MGHNLLTAPGSATLDSLLGLVTLASPEDLPEGASPRCWDVAFITGSVETRPGLSSVYTYAGESVGPKLGGTATDVDVNGNAWLNPDNILGSSLFASAITGFIGSVTETPTAAVNQDFVNLWANPTNIFAVGTSVSTVSLHDPSLSVEGVSSFLLANGMSIDLPGDAVITGISTSFKGKFSGTAAGTCSINVQLASNGFGIGTPVNVPLGTTSTTFTQGSSAYQWGTVLTPAVVNGSSFGILLQAVLNAGAAGTALFTANALTVTVYYTTAATSEVLQVKSFGFSIPSTSGISGFEVSFNASSNNGTILTFQMLQDGMPVGTPKTQTLTSTPTVYTLGAAGDLWGDSWIFSDVNNADFGVQITSSGAGTSSINNLQIETFITPSLENYNYIKSYIQNTGQIDTLALDSAGIVWKEDVTNAPGELSIALTGIIPGSFAKSATGDDREYIMFSDLSIGTDRPRVYDGTAFYPLSPVGPGAPPVFSSTIGSGASLVLTNYSLTSDIVTFTYTGVEPSAGTLITLSIPSVPYLNGQTVTILSTGLSPTQFEVGFTHANDPGGAITGTANIQFSYPIASITQPAANPGGPWDQIVWSTGPGNSTSPGNVITVYYADGAVFVDPSFSKAAKTGQTLYVQIKGSNWANGVWAVSPGAYGFAEPPGRSHQFAYFSFIAPSDNYLSIVNPSGNYQVTLATLTTTTPLLNVVDGDQITITGATPGGWNNNWTIVNTVNSALLNITSTSLAATGVATYGFNIQSGAAAITAGSLITITDTTNGNGVFNVIGYIATTDGTTTFTLNLGVTGQTIGPALETGVGVVAGTEFTFDPGATNLGVTGNAIYGNDTGTGDVAIVGGILQPIGAGTRQGVVFFITESGYETAPSPPITFTTTQDGNYITAAQIPIGPSYVKARGIAFTEAGQNGVPGANFYVIPNPVTVTSGDTTTTFTSTIINDNVTTSAKFTFSDAVLLSSTEIDVQGNDLFNLIELGSSAWCVPYASRMFYGLQLNKVDNFNNLTFDGGYLPNPGGSILPLGWAIDAPSNTVHGVPVTITAFSVASNVVTIFATNTYSAGQEVLFAGLSVATFLNSLILTVLGTGLSGSQFQVAFNTTNTSTTADSGTATSVSNGVTLVPSQVTGMSLYIKDEIEGVTPIIGRISQTAYLDAYQVPIIQINETYSVRVAVSNPSGIQDGTLVIALQDFDQNTGFGTVYGSFSIPFTSMSTLTQVFTGTLLVNAFPNTTYTTGVDPNLKLVVYVMNMGFGADVEIDRIEVFPTDEPYLKAQVYGSYVDDLEAIDASGSGGIIDTSSENQQACMGGFVMHDQLFLLKTSSWYSTEDNPASEPGGWSLREVSSRVGTIGINAYDTGEEWCVTACRQGIYGFNGGQPVKIMQEIYQVWDAINWNAGNTIVLKNDMINKRILCAVPLPTPNQWLPNAPLNAAPTSPNVMLVLDWKGLGSFEELVSSPEVHTTMFGSLAAVDMKRKWTIWQIPTPAMDFIYRQNGIDQPLFIGNGIDSSKIYQLLDSQLSDDGVAINSLYTTYGFVNAAKAATLPIFGFANKRYLTLQVTASGEGTMQCRALPNTINPKYPYTIPGGFALTDPAYDDYYRPLNMRGNRMFLEFSTDAVGSWMNISKLILSGKADPHSAFSPLAGGNAGISS